MSGICVWARVNQVILLVAEAAWIPLTRFALGYWVKIVELVTHQFFTVSALETDVILTLILVTNSKEVIFAIIAASTDP